MKLYNKTRYPDELLTPVLSAAGRAVGARTTGVVVKCTMRRDFACSGTAYNYVSVRRFHLAGRAYTKSSGRTRLLEGVVACDGFIELRLPRHGTSYDPL